MRKFVFPVIKIKAHICLRNGFSMFFFHILMLQNWLSPSTRIYRATTWTLIYRSIVGGLVLFSAGCGGVFHDRSHTDFTAQYPNVVSPNSKATQQAKYKKKMLMNLTIKKAITIALEKNLDYRTISYRIERATGIVVGALGSLTPKVNLSWRYSHADSAGAFFATKLEQRKFQLGGDWNHPDDFGSSNLSFNLAYNLNLAGRELLQYKVAKLRKEMVQLEEEKFRNILLDNIILAYYEALSGEKFIAIARQAVETVSSQLKETEVKFQGGGALKSDVLALKVRLAEAKEKVIIAENRYRLALNALAQLMGLEPNLKMSVMEQNWTPLKLPSTVVDGVAVALTKRVELKQARRKIISAGYGVNIANSGYIPDLQIFGSYYYEDRDFKYSSSRNNWKVGVAIVWNILDGLQTYSKKWQAKALLKEMILLDKKNVLNIKHEVSNAYIYWRESEQREKVLQLAVKQAEENLFLVKKQFQGGAATITKYLDAELSLTNTRFQLTQARYDIKKARARVGRALGLCGSVSGL